MKQLKQLLTGTLTALAIALPASIQPALAQQAPEKPKELAVLALEEGVWDADITFPSHQEGVPDGKAKGVQVNRLRSDGNWMLNEFSVDGTPYQGTGVWGFDPATGEYIGIWTDNNDHRIRNDRGRWDAATNTMNWTAEMVQADGQVIPLKFTELFQGRTRVFHMDAIAPKSGKVIPLLHIIFTKREA